MIRFIEVVNNIAHDIIAVFRGMFSYCLLVHVKIFRAFHVSAILPLSICTCMCVCIHECIHECTCACVHLFMHLILQTRIINYRVKGHSTLAQFH